MAIKKSELYSKLWKSCDELRGGMDASQYKDYILVLLFMRYVSDKYEGDRDALIQIPEGGSFKDLMKLKGHKDIGDETNKVIRRMADANDLVGVITVADFNDADKLGRGKEMVDRLTNLIAIFEDEKLNFSGNGPEGDDILGDAYEYLMKHFATESGKSKGQFYTPAEVSRVMAKVIGIEKADSQNTTLYDPTSGSGSLLLKAADETPRGVTIYGQEKDNATVALAKMNMILHGNEMAEIVQGDTLSSPEFKERDGSLKRFDFAVANPPFSTKSWGNGFDPENDEFERFDGYRTPPAKNGDYAFLLHLIKSLKSVAGKGAIILPHGVLFRGGAEGDIRQAILEKGFIKGIIGLPANLFYGTGIPAAIIIIDKENAETRKELFMIDASKGFIKDGNKNRLREQDVVRIVDVFNGQIEIPKYSRMVDLEEIKENEYNLNIPRYIDNSEEEDLEDIEAHLLGGIPKGDIFQLDKYWQVYPSLKSTLFTNSDRSDYLNLKVGKDAIKETILGHEDFKNYSEEINDLVNTWIGEYKGKLENIGDGTKAKDLIEDMSKDLLNTFTNRNLIDKYDIYQYLMTYWAETMKDDVYIIMENRWIADSDLVPSEITINKYFKEDVIEIENLEFEKDEKTREKEEFEEEHSGEDGVLEEVRNDRGNITKKALNDRIKEIKDDSDYADELELLNKYLKITDEETKANKKVRDQKKELDGKVNEKYKTLTEEEVKNLVVDYKWITHIIEDINGEMERVSHRLTERITELGERYENTLEELEKEVEKYSKNVDEHLKRMGFSW